MEKLDAAQMAAVTTESKLAMVVAGAGAGKTRVLVERIAYLVEKKKVQPEEIIAMTFTRKAARQMRERLQSRLGSTANKVAIGTIHALALGYIKLYGDKLGLRSHLVSVYGPWEEAFLLRSTAKMLKASGPVTVMGEYYKTGIPPADDHPQKRIFDVFMHQLRRNNAMTFGMLVIGMSKLVDDIVKRQIRHLLVDEVQDIDPVQWGVIYGIRNANPDISAFIVGDIDQSIYEWRGAAPETMLTLEDVWDVYKLEENYRSRSEIVDAADRLIQHNVRRIPKRMIANRQREEGDESFPLVLATEVDSAAAARMVQYLNKGGESVAVLSRNHVLLVKLSQELDLINVPHNYCGRDSKLMQSEPFRRVHSILQLVNNNYDNFSFTLAREIMGVADEEYSRIIIRSIDDGRSHLTCWFENFGEPKWTDFFAAGHDVSFFELLEDLQGLIEGSGIDVAKSLSMAMDLAQRGATLGEYLEYIATYDIQEDVPENIEGVQLMTIHAAKGLEFHTVVLVGWNEGLLPSSQSIPDEIEQERRLAYVALTRARDRLFVTTRPEQTEDKRGKVYTNSVSRFISELGVADGRL